jgi:hypothetical protein
MHDLVNFRGDRRKRFPSKTKAGALRVTYIQYEVND